MIRTSLDLFPIDFTNKQCNISNITLVNIYSIWINAITHFLNKEFLNLDALVCENACHIRALALYDIFTKYNTSPYLEKIVTFKKSLNTLIDKTYNADFNDKDYKNSIYNTLKNNNLYIEFIEDIFWDMKFIIHCHVLTITKKQLPLNGFVLNEKTYNKKIMNTGLVSNKAKSFILSTQKELSAMSCQYIQKLTTKQNIPLNNVLIKIQIDNHGRSYLPQYPVGKVFIIDALQKHKTIIIKITRYFKSNFLDNVILYAESDNKINEFKILKSVPKNKPCIILSGIVNYMLTAETQEQYIERINKYPLSLLINANLAAHPQFSGSLSKIKCPYEEAKKDSINNELIDEAYMDYLENKEFALKNGCSLSNPTLLFLNHIYFDLSNNYILTNNLKNTIKTPEFSQTTI